MSQFAKKSVLKTFTLPLMIASITVMSGCATTMKPEVRSAYDQTQQSLANQSVAVITDGCIVRVEIGKNDIMYQQSDLVSLAMAQTVKTRLTEKGLKISNTSSPFVCGTITKDALTKMDILITDKAKDQLNTAYPILSSTNSFDATTNQAYLNLYTALDNKKAEANKAKTAYTALGLDTTSLNSIRKAEGANKVFVAMVTGAKPSFGYSMAIATVSVVATQGTYAGTSYASQGQFYTIYLVNLETNQIEWAKSGDITGNVFKMPVDEAFTLPKMFDPLYAE